MQASQRNLRWLVIGSAILLVVLWARNGATLRQAAASVAPRVLVVIGLFVASRFRRGPRS